MYFGRLDCIIIVIKWFLSNWFRVGRNSATRQTSSRCNPCDDKWSAHTYFQHHRAQTSFLRLFKNPFEIRFRILLQTRQDPEQTGYSWTKKKNRSLVSCVWHVYGVTVEDENVRYSLLCGFLRTVKYTRDPTLSSAVGPPRCLVRSSLLMRTYTYSWTWRMNGKYVIAVSQYYCAHARAREIVFSPPRRRDYHRRGKRAFWVWTVVVADAESTKISKKMGSPSPRDTVRGSMSPRYGCIPNWYVWYNTITQ